MTKEGGGRLEILTCFLEMARALQMNTVSGVGAHQHRHWQQNEGNGLHQVVSELHIVHTEDLSCFDPAALQDLQSGNVTQYRPEQSRPTACHGS